MPETPNISPEPTTLEAILALKQEDVVELPRFASGAQFFARLRRPSIVRMCQLGQIPNPLAAPGEYLYRWSSWAESVPAAFRIVANTWDEVWHTPTELLGGEMTNPEGWEA